MCAFKFRNIILNHFVCKAKFKFKFKYAKKIVNSTACYQIVFQKGLQAKSHGKAKCIIFFCNKTRENVLKKYIMDNREQVYGYKLLLSNNKLRSKCKKETLIISFLLTY